MNILPELSAIAAAKYGLHLKDPIYKAFDKLVQDSRFELIKNPDVDDYTEFDNNLETYAKRNTTCTTIRYILILIQILNGRKGYYAKATPLEPRDTIFYWIDMLLKEFMNSGNGYSYDNHTRGSGVVNGIKMRAAIYYILDILNCENALYADAVTSGVMSSPYFFMGRDITQIVIHGTASGVGTLDTTDGKYYVDVEIYDILKDVTTTLNICLGDSALGEGDTHTITSPSYTNYGDSFYRITVKDFNCDVETNYTFTRENEITPGAVKEKTGTPPMKFYTVDTSLLDWVINGAVGGVGKPGKNYLKPKLEAIPNGAAGSWLSNIAWIADSLDQGYTFNTGEATIITIEFKHEGDANILPAHIGNLMLVEGSTMPTQYDETTNLFKGTITNGCIAVSTYLNNSGNFEVGKTQYLYAGEGEDGISHLYYVLQSRIPQRCKTFAIPVKKNTQYCVKSFNSAYTDIKISLGFLTAPGTITPAVTSCSPFPQKSIPGNETFNENTEQWINLVSSHWRNTSRFQVAVDARPLLYKYCESFATLKAGTYKVMCDVWGNNRAYGSGGWWTGISQYRGNVNDNFDDTGASTNEWFALIAEDNTQIIQKTEIIPTGTTRNQPISYGAPYPNYWHKEVTFTLAADTKVGLMHSAYYSSNSNPNYAYFRFMIVDSDVEAVEFTTTGADPCDMTGYSAWEKYQVIIRVKVYNSPTPEQSELAMRIDIPVDDFLYEGDSVSLTSSSVDITTFEGWNSITINSDVQPTIYIKYQQ